jgi:histidyl-tRNA synthetase
MRDFLPEDVRRRQYVIGVIEDVYQRYGFEPLETPAVENIETLLGKYGEEGDKLIFRILKRGEGAESGQADLALRYDLTVPLARVVAEYKATLPKFFKRYQVQPVWRADRPQKGRFREFFQCDVDAIGSRSMVVEAELLGAASEVLARLGFGEFTVRLNHRGVLSGLLSRAGVPEARHGETLLVLDKLDKVGADGIKGELASRGLLTTGLEELIGFIAHPAMIPGGDGLDLFNTALLPRLREQVSAGAEPALDELAEILRLCERTPAQGRVRLDPDLARGLSYYTGAIFEITVAGLSGSLAGGGRYDDLIGMFLGESVPACGISLGLERILVVMAERGMFPDGLATAPADVMVTIWNLDTAPDALALASELRSSGLRVEVYPEADKLGKQFKYASSRRIPFVTVVGDEEAAASAVQVKEMSTGEQQRVPRADAATTIRERQSRGRRA